MSHTPGPWKVSDLDQRAVEGFDGFVVADVRNWPKTDDARLIAAAPELLEALKAMLNAPDEQADIDAIHAAERAIAKAEGK
jgi:hypothetical protein